jgi:hypothetical protein
MAHPPISEILNPDDAQKDSAQARLSSFRCALFTGARAPMRIASFIADYVNTATLAEGGDEANPDDYTITDQGLPSVLVHTIYYAEGMWYLFYNDHAPYDADHWPFNKIPNPSDPGND